MGEGNHDVRIGDTSVADLAVQEFNVELEYESVTILHVIPEMTVCLRRMSNNKLHYPVSPIIHNIGDTG